MRIIINFLILILLLLCSIKVFGSVNTPALDLPPAEDSFVGVHITPLLGMGIFSYGIPEDNYSPDADYKRIALQYLIKISYGFAPKRQLRFVIFTGYLYKFLKTEWTSGEQYSSLYIIAGGFQFSLLKEEKSGFLPYLGFFAGGAFGKSKATFPVFGVDNVKFLFIFHPGFKYFFCDLIGIDFSVNFLIIPKFKWVYGKKNILIISPSLGVTFRF